MSGRLDAGEDFLTAAVRETREETGFVVDDLNIHEAKQFPMNQFTRKKGKNKTVIFWLAELKDVQKEPKLRPDEHSEYRWVTKEQATELCKMPAFIELINQFDQVARTL